VNCRNQRIDVQGLSQQTNGTIRSKFKLRRLWSGDDEQRKAAKARTVANGPQHFDPIYPGQNQIEDNQVWSFRREQRNVSAPFSAMRTRKPALVSRSSNIRRESAWSSTGAESRTTADSIIAKPWWRSARAAMKEPDHAAAPVR